MLTGTFLAIFFVPLFFVTMLRLFRVKRMSESEEPPHTGGHGTSADPSNGGHA